ncbi:iron chelate uptake ABC transporter family permease subunit [Mobilicoccus pelagius]|uniref:Putative ABC transporter permease protein n=1 Tax=Mobilicoccus pelagius NBRC 104925 TaxID=1089455 RepID=H5UUL7_9MICO|nr:iron chelate uptake ABC transporter family permease subunit [Mobilicoccus pelagius]GAB49425.1 putative ABC transporter permease protein [Mobilicoccus pelagius NBRC 104925]
MTSVDLAAPATAARPARADRPPRPALRLAVAAVLAAGCLGLYLFASIVGPVDFALSLRLPTAAAILVAAFTQALATVVFHTVTDNHILTPSIMGFDSLFVLVQTLLVTLFGGLILTDLDGVPLLLAQTGVMVGFALLLYRWLFSGTFASLHVLLLVGVVVGMAFRSLSTFLERLLHPTDHDLLSVELFGRITDVRTDTLPLAFAVCVGAGIVAWRRRHTLDALLLGREAASGIGVDHRREMTITLVLVAVLVSFSTALVGPLTFFGFVVATLAYQLTGTYRHAAVVPMATALGVILLAGGQFLLQHVFYAAGFLTVLIEFVGGLCFLVLLLRRRSL